MTNINISQDESSKDRCLQGLKTPQIPSPQAASQNFRHGFILPVNFKILTSICGIRASDNQDKELI